MDKACMQSRDLMLDFAGRTGILPGPSPPRRYLWTDAFAVCNFLELYHRTGERQFLDLALRLVDQVHSILGRHRDDDTRTGWISGLDEASARLHPTRGGLRIGKKLAERLPGDAYDEQLEWDRDGQYYHYLTKWMHALSRVSRVTGDERHRTWAIELAQAVHPRFTYISPVDGKKYMHWKMSIDLSRPLVPAMGQHDPLDGLITCYELQQGAAGEASAVLRKEIEELSTVCEGLSWSTDDPLGIGGLLSDTCRLAQMHRLGWQSLPELFGELLADSLEGLESFIRSNALNLPPEYRLAFRELGLAIGLHGVSGIKKLFDNITEPAGFSRFSARLNNLAEYLPLARKIERFWLQPENRQIQSWTDHGDINTVMLATSLLPSGFLMI